MNAAASDLSQMCCHMMMLKMMIADVRVTCKHIGIIVT